MSNVIKYTTTPVNDTIKKGNFALGVNDVDYGPTNITGFYATTIPSTSGYTIYNQSGGTLSYQSVSGTTDLINYLSNKRGVNMTTDGEALSWAAGQSSIFVTNREYENIVTSGMVLNLDAGFVSSYPTSATTWYDLSYSGNNGTLTNGPTFNSFNGGSIVFDGTDDYVLTPIINHNIGTGNFSYSAWVYPIRLKGGGATISSFIGNGDYSPTFGFDLNNYPNQLGYYWNGWKGFGSNPTLYQWNHVTMTRIGTLVIGFLNGVACPITYTDTWSMSNSINVMGRSGVTYEPDTFKGNISSAQIYNKSLSPFEVYQNYNAMKGRFGIPDIVTSGLTLNMDAGNPYSYNPLNTGSTTWVNTTNITSGGTLTNGTFYSGGTMVFDGVDDYTSVSNFMGNTNTFTVSHFIYLNGSQNTKTIFSNYGVGNNGWVTGIRDDQNNVFKFYLGNTVHLYSNTVLSSFTWYHVAVTYNNGSPIIYVNGVLDNSSSNTITFASSYFGNDIGRLGVGSQYFKGTIGNVQVYNRALNPIEIYQNFNALKNRYGFYDIVQEGLVLNLDAGNPNSYNPLNTGSTTWTDVSGYGSNGTLINGTFYSGGTMVFDGVDDYISVPKQTAFVNASQFTLMAWMKRRTVSSKVICHQGSDLNNDVSFELWNDGYAYFEVGNAGNTYANIANTSTNWQYMTMVFDGTQTGDSNRLKCYINGSLLNVAYNGTIPSTSGPSNSIFSIGNTQGTGGNYSDGNISVVQVYNRALSASEVQQNFNALRGRYGI